MAGGISKLSVPFVWQIIPVMRQKCPNNEPKISPTMTRTSQNRRKYGLKIDGKDKNSSLNILPARQTSPTSWTCTTSHGSYSTECRGRDSRELVVLDLLSEIPIHRISMPITVIFSNRHNTYITYRRITSMLASITHILIATTNPHI